MIARVFHWNRKEQPKAEPATSPHARRLNRPPDWAT